MMTDFDELNNKTYLIINHEQRFEIFLNSFIFFIILNCIALLILLTISFLVVCLWFIMLFCCRDSTGILDDIEDTNEYEEDNNQESIDDKYQTSINNVQSQHNQNL